MEIELQWAFTEEDMRTGPCAICGLEFEPRAVIIRSGPHGLETCEECLRALSFRKEREPSVPWPTWEEYRALVEGHPEPMFASPEEAEASEREGGLGGGGWPAYEASWLWAVPEEEDIHITPTIIHRAYAGPDVAHEFTHGVATAEHQAGRALIVFRSQEEAEKYRSATGKHSKEEGFKTATLDLEELGHVLEEHGCTHVAMPEPWTGEGEVDFFKAADFIGMLEESVPA
ncbi:MAG: hypothetical protein M3R38_17430 [Actinomycetota bacterium]|nr:hypothetical protein [Actinomycetota bacterium]